jgi:uncharacterized membrane protein
MIYTSGVFSLVVQLLVGIIDYLAINIEIDKKDEFLIFLIYLREFACFIDKMNLLIVFSLEPKWLR